MSKSTPPTDPEFSRAVFQASAWIAFLHGPGRSPASEQGLRDWLAESPLHRQAFEVATDTWDEHRALVRRSAKIKFMLPGESEEQTPPVRLRKPRLVALALIFMLGGFHTAPQPQTFSTGLLEQRAVYLEDGTRVMLNVDTSIIVSYNKEERLVRVESGEAVFDVAKEPERPFVAVGRDQEVRALGTSFHMRVDADYVSVALIEGKVTVSPVPSDSPHTDHTHEAVQTLSPGDRILIRGGAHHPEWDRPALERLTAWENGMVDMDDMTLADAVREMNRYSNRRVLVEVRHSESVRVGGIFRIGDSLSFAHAVASGQGWKVQERGDQIVLVESARPH